MLFAQIDNGMVTGTLEAEQPPTILPAGRTFVRIPDGVTVSGGETYDAQTRTFGTRAVQKRLAKADVIGALTPAQWAEMNKFSPTAVGTSLSGVPYNDPAVFWAVSVFNAAEKDFALNDPRMAQIIGLLVTKGVISADDSTALMAKLAAVAK